MIRNLTFHVVARRSSNSSSHINFFTTTTTRTTYLQKKSISSFRIGVLKGDGIGPEMVETTLSVLQATIQKVNKTEIDRSLKVEFVHLPIGFEGISDPKHQHPISEIVKNELSKCSGWILGPHDSASYPPQWKTIRNPSGELRHHFDLFSNLRPARNLPNISSLIKNMDLVIVRENTEGFYPDRNLFRGNAEMMPTPDIAITSGIFTRSAARRISRVAFELAKKRNKLLKVTVVHKANVMPMTTGMLLEVCKEISTQFPEIRVDDYHVDAVTAHIIRDPSKFDVIVTENMFGDILSDMTGELIGSLGLAPSINHNNKYAMAQAAHGAAPDIAGKGISNPTSLLLSTSMLAEWLSEHYNNKEWHTVSQLIERAVWGVFDKNDKKVLTRDVGGEGTTKRFGEEVVKFINATSVLQNHT